MARGTRPPAGPSPPSQPGASDLVEVASDICGAHTQVAASAELMLGLRVRTITLQHVRTALWADRTLVKTVGLRGTLHLMVGPEPISRPVLEAQLENRAGVTKNQGWVGSYKNWPVAVGWAAAQGRPARGVESAR